MTVPCMLGFRCPYHRINEDGEGVCANPNLTFPMPDNMESADCPLMTPDCKLEDILRRVEQEMDEKRK